MPVAAALLLTGALQAEPATLHTPLDRAVTAERLYVDCLVEHARRAASGRAGPRVAINIARRECSAELQALDDVRRGWNRSQGRGNRGVSRADLGRLVAEAEARVIAERGGR